MLAFRSAGRALAIDAAAVAEIAVAGGLTHVPLSPAALKGLANLRGQVAPVVSLAEALGLSGEPGGEGRLLVLAGDDPLALAIDSVIALQAPVEGPAGLEIAGVAVERLDVDALIGEAFGALQRRTGARQVSVRAVDHAEVADARAAYLQVSVGDQAYALPLEAVAGVMSLPTKIADVASADPAMLGAVEHGDGLLPLVSLRKLLAAPSSRQEAMVVVTQIGDSAVGLVVDVVTAVLRVTPDMVGDAPAILNRGSGEAKIQAIARTPDGLVCLLHPQALFDAATLALASGAGMASDHAEEAVSSESVVLFRLGPQTYGVPAAMVREVVRAPAQLTRPPRLPAFIAGVMNHRGEPLAVIDQGRRFATEPNPGDGQVIVLAIGDLSVGLLVDAVETLVQLSAEAISRAPPLIQARSAVFDRVCQVDADGRLILLIAAEALAEEARRDLQAALA
jgi:purine-binding chemotaxis protein CheW